jgi:hypothetical protein
MESQDSITGMLTMLWVGQLSNHGLIPCGEDFSRCGGQIPVWLRVGGNGLQKTRGGRILFYNPLIISYSNKFHGAQSFLRS